MSLLAFALAGALTPALKLGPANRIDPDTDYWSSQVLIRDVNGGGRPEVVLAGIRSADKVYFAGVRVFRWEQGAFQLVGASDEIEVGFRSTMNAAWIAEDTQASILAIGGSNFLTTVQITLPQVLLDADVIAGIRRPLTEVDLGPPLGKTLLVGSTSRLYGYHLAVDAPLVEVFQSTRLAEVHEIRVGMSRPGEGPIYHVRRSGGVHALTRDNFLSGTDSPAPLPGVDHSSARSMLVFDMEGNGLEEILITTSVGPMRVLTWNGAQYVGHAADFHPLSAGGGRSSSILDVDNDEQPELVTKYATSIGLTPVPGDGSLGSELLVSTTAQSTNSEGLHNMAWGDLDGDGCMDLVITSRDQDEPTAFFGRSCGATPSLLRDGFEEP
ncbi:MAG: VCBS repeat-containing protein [Xanthomonadales bacterium]|nr:VCBS repeat-containing protein [Xanthomonadales bacterium]